MKRKTHCIVMVAVGEDAGRGVLWKLRSADGPSHPPREFDMDVNALSSIPDFTQL
jgi:hypothetical protein